MAITISSTACFAQYKKVKNPKKRKEYSAVDIASPLEYVGTMPPCPKVTVDGTTFTVDPCYFIASIAEGDTDQFFDFSIVPSRTEMYGFIVPNSTTGFPLYALLSDIGSGGASGRRPIRIRLSSRYLSADGDKPKVYEGSQPIIVFHEPTAANEKTINVAFKITVTPKKAK